MVNRGLWYSPHPTFISTNLTNPIFTDVSTSNPANTNGDSQVTASLWLSDADFGTASIAGSDLRPDGSRYIGCKMKNNIYFIRISSSGTLSYWKRYNHSSLISGNGCRAEMEMNFDNVSNTFKIAFESRTGAPTPSGGFSSTYCVKYFELSNNLLTSVNQQSINLPYYLYVPPSNYDDKPLAGIEFSPDKKYIYLTSASTNGGLTQRLYTIDLSVGSPTVTPFAVTGSVQEQVKYGSIETGLDGNLYFASSFGLYRLTNPNVPNPANFSPTSFINFAYNENLGANTGGSAFSSNEYLRGYTLPGQVDGMNYQFHFTSPVECCIANNSFDINTYTNTGNATWTQTLNPFNVASGGIIYVKTELRIKQGTTVNINNMSFRFASGARIVIEEGTATVNGGKLVLNNSILTNDPRCNVLWEGVEVRGNNTLNQGGGAMGSVCRQGRFLVLSNSKVENAKIGASNFRRTATGAPVFGTTGGVIYAFNSSFLNNKSDAIFSSYQSPTGVNDLSIFYDCNFKTTATLLDNSNPSPHVQLARVKGVQFIGNEFENTAVTYTGINRGIGIRSNQSSPIVVAGCTALDPFGACIAYNNPNIFKNLHTGIHQTQSISNVSLKADRNSFINNNTGVYIKTTSFAQISRNNFIVEETAGIETFGIYMLDGNTHFIIDENTFIVDLPVLTLAPTFGIWTKSCGTENNQIYKNTFTNMNIGTYVTGTNATITPVNNVFFGLEYKCNNYNTKLHDLFLENGSIKQNQGSAGATVTTANQNSANNTFTLGSEPQSTLHDFRIVGLQNTSPIRYHHVSGALQTPFSYNTGTLNPVQNLAGGSPVILNQSIGCPTRLDVPGGQIGQKEAQITAINTQINSGNSQAIIDNINTGNISTKLNSVLAVAPYASDDVLISYLRRSPSNGHVKQVITANSPVSSIVKTELNTMNLPNGIMNQINSAQGNGITPIEMAYMEISKLRLEIENEVDNQIRTIIFDETGTKTSTDLKNILSVRPEKFYKQVEIINDISRGEITLAQTEIDNLGSYGRTQELNQIEIGIKTANSIEDYYASNPSAITTLESIINDSTSYCICSGRAESMLLELNGQCGEQFVYPYPPCSSVMNVINNPNESNSSSDKSYIEEVQSIYPNPAETEITVTNLDIEEGTIYILDLTGKVLICDKINESNNFKIESLNSGAYILQIRDKNNLLIQTEQFFKK